MNDILFRCSAVGKLMTEPTAAAIKAGEVLSVGAKTHVREIAAQAILGIDFEISSKEIEKGNECEPESNALFNRVRGLTLVKNTERRKDDYLTGECDLFDAPALAGYDLKTSWSAKTFPICELDCHDKLYEWQARAYMRLWGAKRWTVAYALVNTPERLIGFEPVSMHFFDHIPEHMRLTTWTIEHDAAEEARMVEKVKAARLYYAQVVAEFDRTHRIGATVPTDPDAALKSNLLARSPAIAAGLPAQATAPAALPENLFA